MATTSLALWDQLQQAFGVDTGFRRCGLLYLSDDPAEVTAWADWCRFAADEGVISQPLSSAEATELGTATVRVWSGGVFSASDGIADPSLAVPSIAQGIEALGGRVLQNCAVRGVLTQAGRISGVVTEHGEIRCSHVVMAGGAWASSFCHQLGIAFPQVSVRSSVLSVAPGVQGLPEALHTSQASVTRRGDGGYTLAISGLTQMDVTAQKLRFAPHFLPMFAERWRFLSIGPGTPGQAGHETRKRWALDAVTPMERQRSLDPKPDRSTIDKTTRRARGLLPVLREAEMAETWASYIDTARLTGSRSWMRSTPCRALPWRRGSVAMALASVRVPGT